MKSLLPLLFCFFLAGCTPLRPADPSVYLRAVPGQRSSDGVSFVAVRPDGALAWVGHYADSSMSVPVGPFVYYHPNGAVESRGSYDADGQKVGEWRRWAADGTELSTRIYDPWPLRRILGE